MAGVIEVKINHNSVVLSNQIRSPSVLKHTTSIANTATIIIGGTRMNT